MRKVFRLNGLCCANCAAKIERRIQKIKGIQEASVSFMAQKLMIECEDAHYSAILDEIKEAIKKIEPDCELIG